MAIHINPDETGVRARKRCAYADDDGINALQTVMNASCTPVTIADGALSPWKAMVHRKFVETAGDDQMAMTSTPNRTPYEVNQLSPAVFRHQGSSFAVCQPPVLHSELRMCYLREGNLALFSFTGWLATGVHWSSRCWTHQSIHSTFCCYYSSVLHRFSRKKIWCGSCASDESWTKTRYNSWTLLFIFFLPDMRQMNS